jgi:hypothetical protein
METGKWWPFCEDEKSGRCFDLDKKVVRGNPKPWTKRWLMDTSSHPTPANKYATSDV